MSDWKNISEDLWVHLSLLKWDQGKKGSEDYLWPSQHFFKGLVQFGVSFGILSQELEI